MYVCDSLILLLVILNFTTVTRTTGRGVRIAPVDALVPVHSCMADHTPSLPRWSVLHDCWQELAPKARHVCCAEVVRVTTTDSRISERVAVLSEERSAIHHEQSLRAISDASVEATLKRRCLVRLQLTRRLKEPGCAIRCTVRENNRSVRALRAQVVYDRRSLARDLRNLHIPTAVNDEYGGVDLGQPLGNDVSVAGF